MAVQVLPSKLTPEGRATVPAEARRALGAKAGDRLVFLVEDGEVRVLTARQLAVAAWSGNGTAVVGDDDAVADVRAARDADVQAGADVLVRIEADVEQAVADDARSDEELADDLLAGLDL